MNKAPSVRRRQGKAKSAPKQIGVALKALVKDIGIAGTLAQYEVIASWPQLVGEQIAKVTEAKRMDNGVLFVAVANAPWRAELTMRRVDIARKINATMGKRIVKEIRFR